MINMQVYLKSGEVIKYVTIVKYLDELRYEILSETFKPVI